MEVQQGRRVRIFLPDPGSPGSRNDRNDRRQVTYQTKSHEGKENEVQQTRSSNTRTLHLRFVSGIRPGRNGQRRGEEDRPGGRQNHADQWPDQKLGYGRGQHDDGVPRQGSRNAQAGEGRGQGAVRSRACKRGDRRYFASEIEIALTVAIEKLNEDANMKNSVFPIRVWVVAVFAGLSSVALAQSVQPYSGMQNRPIKA